MIYQYDKINMEYHNNVNQFFLDVMEKFTERLQMLEDQIQIKKYCKITRNDNDNKFRQNFSTISCKNKF